MHPGDRLGPIPDGVSCTACGASVPAGRIRILAHRDDLAFVELACHDCGSSALGLLLAADVPGDPPLLDVVDDHPRAAAISMDDVVAVRRFLADWQGDLRTLLVDGP